MFCSSKLKAKRPALLPVCLKKTQSHKSESEEQDDRQMGQGVRNDGPNGSRVSDGSSHLFLLIYFGTESVQTKERQMLE